jgi:hypothetical protein
MQAALQKDHHVLHFLGHGTAGHLFLTANDRTRIAVDDASFATSFLGRRNLRLLVLNACQSSQARGDIFSGIGPALVRRGVPAVVAMQYSFVFLDTAAAFSRAFYGALANGRAVDVAVNEGRQALATRPPDLTTAARDWSTPILYMGTRTGQILQFKDDQASDVQQAWNAISTATDSSAELRQALAELTKTFKGLLQMQRRLSALVEIERRLQAVREEYTAADEVIRDAKGRPDKLDFGQLTEASTDLRQRGLEPLGVFVADQGDAAIAPWLDGLIAAADLVDTKISNGEAQGLIATVVPEFGRTLAKAEASAQLARNKAIGDLLNASNRTLARLESP